VNKPRFVSQIGKVNENTGCGVASTMMILRNVCESKNLPTYKELAECLWVNVNPEIKGFNKGYGKGVDFDDVVMFLKRVSSVYDFHYHKLEKSNYINKLKNVLHNYPVMAAMENDVNGRWSGGHWIVLYGYGKSVIQYLDPQYKSSNRLHDETMSIEEFSKLWSGYAVWVNSNN